MKFSFEEESIYWTNELVSFRNNPLEPIILKSDMEFISNVEDEINNTVNSDSDFLIFIERSIENNVFCISLFSIEKNIGKYYWNRNDNIRDTKDFPSSNFSAICDKIISSSFQYDIEDYMFLDSTSYYIFLRKNNETYRMAFYKRLPDHIHNELDILDHLLNKGQ